MVIKKIPTVKPSEFWFGWLVRPRAWRAWNASGHLMARGVPTPEPLAYIAKGNPGVSSGMARLSPASTYTILERPEGMTSLAEHMEQKLVQLSPTACYNALRHSVEATARVARVMHEHSISHRDMKAANILVRPRPDGSWQEMQLIDLVGAELVHPLPYSMKVKNLARLTLSFYSHGLLRKTLALRFLRSYLPLAYLPRDAWKELWRDIQAEVDRKIQKNKRSGRPLS